MLPVSVVETLAIIPIPGYFTRPSRSAHHYLYTNGPSLLGSFQELKNGNDIFVWSPILKYCGFSALQIYNDLNNGYERLLRDGELERWR